MRLNLLEKPKEELISLSEAKGYLHVSHNCDDDLIKFLIKSNREAIETIVQQSIVKQTWKYTVKHDEFSNVVSDDGPYVFGSLISIPLPRPPVLEVKEVIIDGETIDKKKVKLQKDNNVYFVRISNIKNFENCHKVTVVYSTGLAETSEEVPEQIRLANLMLVANAYQDRYTTPLGIIPSIIHKLLSPFLNLRFL